MFTKEQVQNMSEKDLRQQVLIPLLQSMNFQGVCEYHGRNEFGKDIICWKVDELANRDSLALVVKAVTVSGQSKDCADIENQVRQCFSKPYIDPVTGLEESINRCWIVSNKPITNEAADHIKSGIGHAVYTENVKFVDIGVLWELIEKHMPLAATLQKLEGVRHDFETWDTHYRIEAKIDGAGIHHTLAEKFPGAALEKPLKIRSVFEFPDTEDGKEHLQALERFVETGAPAKIPAAYIKKLEYSEFLQHIYPTMTKDGFIELGSIPHPRPLLLRCEISCDDGDHCSIDYIHLVCIQVGQKEATLTNDGQPIPFRMQLVLRMDGQISHFHIELESNVSLNVHQQLAQMQFVHCFSKPHTVHFTNLDTGIVAGSSRSEVGLCEAPDENALEAVAALDALQRKSQKLVSIPGRDLTPDEYQDINMLRALFRTGKIGATWHNSSATIIITDETRVEIAQMIDLFDEGHGRIFLQQEEVLSLFGEEYALGPVQLLLLPAKMVNSLEIRIQLERGFSGEIPAKFVPTDDGRFTKEYLWWLPPNNGTTISTNLPAGVEALSD